MLLPLIGFAEDTKQGQKKIPQGHCGLFLSWIVGVFKGHDHKTGQFKVSISTDRI
jgi:hypothetical protein